MMNESQMFSEEIHKEDHEEVFYNISNLPLADQSDWEKRMIYRVILRSMYPPTTWLLDRWYSVHFGLVNEMSLFPRNALKKGTEFRCYAQVLSVMAPNKALGGVKLEIEALPESERQWTNLSELTWPGLSGGRGAVSIRLTLAQDQQVGCPDSFLLKLGIPRGKSEDTLHVLPLIIGPFKLTSDENHTLSGEELLLFHRQLPGHCDRSVLIKESPEIAIPGKIWDSALFAAPTALKYVHDLADPHVLDLSCGTGVCGLWIATILQRGKVTLTDLSEALPTMSANVSLNQPLIEGRVEVDVRQLRWGMQEDLPGISEIDVVVACDLIYEAELLSILVDTLDKLTTRGRTNVIVGYKQRGLTQAEKKSLWQTFEQIFSVQKLEGIAGAMEKECHSDQVGVELWRLWKPYFK